MSLLCTFVNTLLYIRYEVSVVTIMLGWNLELGAKLPKIAWSGRAAGFEWPIQPARLSVVRSRSATSRSALRSRCIVFCHTGFTFHSTPLHTPPDFLPAPLRFPLRSLTAHMLWSGLLKLKPNKPLKTKNLKPTNLKNENFSRNLGFS